MSTFKVTYVLRGQTLLACHLLSGTLYRRLRGASFALLHSPQLVCEVRGSCYLLKYIVEMHINFLFILFRCMAVRGELDVDVLYQCREHTDVLVESIDLGVL